MTPQPTKTKDGYLRDSRRQRLYDAELIVRVEARQPLMTLEEIEQYVSRLHKQAWTQRNWRLAGRRMPTITSANSGAHYSPNYMELAFSRACRTELLVLHEYAHYLSTRCATSCNGGRKQGSWCGYEAIHGWHFAKIMLMLVRHQMGKEMHDRLRDSYKRHGVRYTKPRQLSPEAKQAAAARLIAVRAAAKES